MCVIFFYANSNPGQNGYKLILASNRDEFYNRETQKVNKWPNSEHVYGGIDLEPGREGGTWLAIGGQDNVFKIGALLNLTGEPKPRNAVGRGMIVSDFVTTSINECTIDEYNRNLLADCTKYSAFNFIAIQIGQTNEPADIQLCSNCPPGLTKFTNGQCYGFGNSLPDIPFEKVKHGQQQFEKIVQDFNAKRLQTQAEAMNSTTTSSSSTPSSSVIQAELVKNLQNLLKSREKFWPDAELKRRAPNWGEELSALNVVIPNENYGSRTHSVILVDANNEMHFYEETMSGTQPDGEWIQTHIVKQYFQHQ